MERREFLGVSVGALAAGLLGLPRDRGGEAGALRPMNVLFIMTDQQYGGCVGYADHPYVKTPNLDSLAREGVVFDNAYCAHPVCTASRCSILTGTWPHTHNVHLNVGSPEKDASKGLQCDAVMTESVLHRHGYVTKHRGKWHCGDQKRHACYQAEDGFRYLGEYGRYLRSALSPEELDAPPGEAELHGYPLYMTPEAVSARKRMHENKWVPVQDITLIGRTAIPSEYMDDTWVTDQAIDLLEKYKDQPFMITCSVHPPHAYWVAPEPYYSMYDPKDIELPPNQTHPPICKDTMSFRLFESLGTEGVKEFLRCYFAQVTHVDMNIGRLVGKLKEIGQYENTLIVFTSDHGDMNGAHQMVGKCVGPLHYKETNRVPLLMVCPKLLPKGRRVRTAANGVDLMPTILDYLDLPVPQNVQGESLRPYIEGREDLDRAGFCEGTHPRVQQVIRTIRTHEWRYTFCYQKRGGDEERFPPVFPPELFQVSEDPGEERDLGSHPKYREVVRRLDRRLRDYLSSTDDPWLGKLPPLEA